MGQPYNVGMTGLIGFASGYHAMQACDTLLMLGTDFPYRQFFPDEPGSRRSNLAGGHRPACAGRAWSGRPGRGQLAALLPRLTARRTAASGRVG